MKMWPLRKNGRIVSRQTPSHLRPFFSALKFGSMVLVGTYLLGLALYLGLRVIARGQYWWLALLDDFAPILFVPLPLAMLIACQLQIRSLIALASVQCLIAGLWFGPRFLPKYSNVISDLPLNVVTFNVWGYNTRLDEVQAWLKDTNADVVLLQEIPEQYANHQISELAEYYPYQVSQPTSIRWWGNLFLSRYPILSVEDLPGDGVPAQQRFTIDFDGQVLAIYNGHFAMPIGAPRFPHLENHYVLQMALSYNASARNAEIVRLLARLETEPYPYIVAGDFNMSEYATIYARITDSMIDAYRAGNRGWGGTWPVSIVDELPRFIPPLLRVDYVWHSEDFCTIEAQVGPKLGSDHLPMYAKLGLKIR